MDPLVPKLADYLGYADFALRISPCRRALLVEDGNREQLSHALSAAVAVWGGGRWPVIRVSAEGAPEPADIQISQIMSVADAVDFRTATAPAVVNLPFPVVPAPPLEDATFWQPHPVVPRHEQAIKEIFTSTSATLLTAAGAGRYALSDEVPTFREAGYSVAEDAGDDLLGIAQLGDRTAWAASLAADTDSEVQNARAASIGYLMVSQDPDNFEDAVIFWNCRALRPRLTSRPFPVTAFVSIDTVRSSRFQSEFVDAIRRSSRSTPAFILACDEEVREEIGAALGAERYTSSEYSEIWGTVQVQHDPLSYGYNVDPTQLWLSQRSPAPAVSQAVTLQRPAIHVEWSTPVEWDPKYLMRGHVTAQIRSRLITGPRLDSVANLFITNATWSGEDLRVITANVPEYRFRIGIPTPEEVLRTALGTSGIAFTLSDKGQQIAGLIRAHTDVQIFRERATFEVVRALTRQPGRDLSRELKHLREANTVTDETLERLRAQATVGKRPAKTLAQVAAQVAQADPVSKAKVGRILDLLLGDGSVETGLVVECRLCLLKEFTPLSDAGGAPYCAGCGSRAQFKATPVGEPQIHFRLTSLIHTTSLNGGLVPLAAYALLENEGAFVIPGANLQRGELTAGEVDLLGWVGPHIFAAEAKTSLGGFAATDIGAELKKLAASGADQVLLICGEAFTSDLRGEAVHEAGTLSVELRIVDATELWDTGE